MQKKCTHSCMFEKFIVSLQPICKVDIAKAIKLCTYK